MRKIFIAAVLLVMAAPLLPGPASAQGSPGKQSETLFEWTNQERATRGLPALQWNQALASAAQKHADRMARENVLSHQLPGEPALTARAMEAGAHFSLLAENIAFGPSLETIHASWMGSKLHRENILDSQLTAVGIAVSERNGEIFAVQDFSQSQPNLSMPEQEARVGALLKARGLHLLDPSADAEQACKSIHGFPPAQPPLAAMWFETSDLSKLPASLVRKLQSGNYKSAMVGACPSDSSPGFTTFHFAVLLY